MSTTIKIVFRGLMVLNYQRDQAASRNYMEMGFLDALPHANGHGRGDHTSHSMVHIPRILTMKGGILTSVIDLRLDRPELGTVRNWELSVTNSAQNNTTLRNNSVAQFDRTVDPATANQATREDFRWIIDFEARDMHDRRLTPEIGTRKLLLVLLVRNGDFFTKFHSPELTQRKGTGTPTPFGYVAAATGCDISFNAGGNVRLMAGSTEVFVFNDPDAIYEISNAPPDVLPDAPTPLGQSHFHMYYDGLFIKPPADQISFIADDLAPGPDPALCGLTSLGQREDPL
ncbi:MAG TPA: hypothetical protein VFX97_00665 [Pyrinomonadaceae bacterium]|nr:hypothetical protein [Pyrinomonadaceae bacterium]